MSLSAYKAVWQHSKAKGNHRLVLLAIADFADENLIGWPSAKTIQEMVNLKTERNVRRLLSELIDMGELEKVGKGRNGTIKYRLTPVCGDRVKTVETDNTLSEETPVCRGTLSEETPASGDIPPLSEETSPPCLERHSPPVCTDIRTVIEPSLNHQGTVSINVGQSSKGTAVTLAAFGIEDKTQKQEKPQKAKAKKPTRIPDDWDLSEGGKVYAIEKGFNPDQIDNMAEDFVGYWKQKTGTKAKKLDWALCWQSWVRNDIKFNGDPRKREAQNKKFTTQDVYETTMAAARRRDAERGLVG